MRTTSIESHMIEVKEEEEEEESQLLSMAELYVLQKIRPPAWVNCERQEKPNLWYKILKRK